MSAPASWWRFGVAVSIAVAGTVGFIWIYFTELPPLALFLAGIFLAAGAVWALTQCSVSLLHVTAVVTVVGVIAALSAIPRGDKREPPARVPPGTSVPVVRPSSLQLTVNPAQGPAGGTFQLRAAGYQPRETVRIELYRGPGLDKFDGPYIVEDVTASPKGELVGTFVINDEICCQGGEVVIRATGRTSHNGGSARFRLTE